MHTQITPRNTHHDSSSIQNHQTMTRHVMSLREISCLIGKRPDPVMYGIRRMLGEVEITDPKIGDSYQDETGADRAASQPLITLKGLACLVEKNIGVSL